MGAAEQHYGKDRQPDGAKRAENTSGAVTLVQEICGTSTCPEAPQANGFCKRGENERTESNDGVVRGAIDP
eukprot:scaffold58429_cov56-Cyclotella_meneghiniana.AAC.1